MNMNNTDDQKYYKTECDDAFDDNIAFFIEDEFDEEYTASHYAAEIGYSSNEEHYY